MRILRLRRVALILGLLTLGSASVGTSAMSGEILHRVLPSQYVEAPVEPAPPNAGYYPTRWNRWDSEQAYLPGLRKAQAPPQAATPRDESSEPKGNAAPAIPPVQPSPKREGDIAPRPPASAPKTSEPAPLPGGGVLPPLPGAAPNSIPEPAPMPEKGTSPPPRVESPKTPPKVEKPQEPEIMPPPMELPPPQLPKEDKPSVPGPNEPELKLPDSKKIEPQEPKKEPTDNLFEAPPRSGDKNQTKGASLPDRPSIRTMPAKGHWVAIGSSAMTAKSLKREIAPVSDLEEATVRAKDTERETFIEGRPARLPADEEAMPLSSAQPRPTAGAATARFKPARDTSVRPVSCIEPVPAGGRPLINPLRRQ